MVDPVSLAPMPAVAAKLGIPESALEPYGRSKAKIDLSRIDGFAARPMGRLVLVTAISPTTAGEGKTTTTIGLGDALNRLGRRTAIVLREPSLGPCFGQKGGATGGGRAQIGPADDINLHFTGDFHAITSAHNLLAALIDNHLQWGTEPKIDPARITWPRVMDMNDRALRFISIGNGGKAHGVPRSTRFDITPASEVMAILCLSRDLRDLKRRLGDIVVAQRADGTAVRAADFKAVGSMATLLRDALKPNLVQTLEGNPAIVHGGPFANIAHGCNSVIATTAGLRLADITVTEAGFGADLGAEKFLDIKCRQAGIWPSAAVIVATVRALKLHGGADPKQLATEDLAALGRGIGNLARHIENLGKFGLPVIVAVNRFASDTEAEIRSVADLASKLGARLAVAEHFARGGEGAEPLARAVLAAIEGTPPQPKYLYPDAMPLADKIGTIAREIYRAADTTFSDDARARLAAFEAAGFASVPVCIAKTQYSFSTDAKAVGAPSGHTLHVREARLSAGAGFVVAVCGDILTMPGLPRVPASDRIDIDDAGQIHGLT